MMSIAEGFGSTYELQRQLAMKKVDIALLQQENETLRQELLETRNRVKELAGGTKRDLMTKLEQQRKKNTRLEKQLAELRKAQEQPVCSTGEPAYYEIETPDGIKCVGTNPCILANHTSKPLYTSPPVATQGEPVAWIHRESQRISLNHYSIDDIPLYTSTPSITEGWQLVPIEPTIEMRTNGIKAYHDEQGAGIIDAYKAMLSAAPKP